MCVHKWRWMVFPEVDRYATDTQICTVCGLRRTCYYPWYLVHYPGGDEYEPFYDVKPHCPY